MKFSVKNMYHSIKIFLNTPKGIRTLQAIVIASIASLAPQVLAAGGSDILAGTTSILTETLKGTGKTYLYITECIVSLIAYIQSKNIMILLGIVVVAIFFNVMLSVSGVT